MMPTKEEIEEYLNSLDEWVSNSLHAATSDIPSLNSIANRIWVDLGRFGAPSLQVPGLGIFDVPPPPPPVQELSWLERTGAWVSTNRWKTLCFVLGSGLLVGYASTKIRRSRVRIKKRNTSRALQRKDVAGTTSQWQICLILTMTHDPSHSWSRLLNWTFISL